MGYKVRKKTKVITPSEVREMLRDEHGGREYLDRQLRSVFVTTVSSSTLN